MDKSIGDDSYEDEAEERIQEEEKDPLSPELKAKTHKMTKNKVPQTQKMITILKIYMKALMGR
jgi:hypothetical protein